MLKKSIYSSVLLVYLSTCISRLKPCRFMYNIRKYCLFYLVIHGNTWKAHVDKYTRRALVKVFFYHSDLMLKNCSISRIRLKLERFSRKCLCFHVSLESLHSILLIFYVPIAFLLKNKFFKMLNFYIRCSTCFLIVNKLFKKLNFFLYVVLSAPFHCLYVYFLNENRKPTSKYAQIRSV